MVDKNTSIESKLFEWDTWDNGAEFMCIMFNDIVLKKDIGIYKKGTIFKWCELDFQKSEICFGNEEPVGRYKLELDVLSELSEVKTNG